MNIIDLIEATESVREQVAEMVWRGFAVGAPAWCPTIESAREEVAESLVVAEAGEKFRFSLVALDDANGNALGWIGGLSSYDGRVCELHPLVVSESARGTGVGKALVAALEDRARAAGAVTMFLGTDDEVDRTSLYGRDLYPDPLREVAAVENLRAHPFGFYQKCGYVVCGVLPDANGFGKPDIFMCKRLQR